MEREQVIALAREAGWQIDGSDLIGFLERFAALVEQATKERACVALKEADYEFADEVIRSMK